MNYSNEFNSIYRNFIRSIKKLNRKKNLLNLYQNQFKSLKSNQISLKELRIKVNKTISILTTSTNLITSITNLNYHYTTTPSFNSSRKLTDQIIWKPNQPEEAIKSWETLRLKRSKDESYKMGEEVILTLQRDFKRAESEGGILLGSIDEKS